MSEWNKISGNWSFEERDFSKWGKERYKEILQAEETVNKTGYKGTYKVTKIDGDVFCIVSHGQLKYIANFDELKITFASTEAGQGAGTVMMEIENEIEYKFTYKTKPANQKQFEDNFKKMIEETLVMLKDELKLKLQSATEKK